MLPVVNNKTHKCCYIWTITHAENRVLPQPECIDRMCLTVGFTGFMIAFLVCVCSNKKLRSLPNYFIVNLAVSDFLMASTQSPIFFINCLYKEWVFGEMGNSFPFRLTSYAAIPLLPLLSLWFVFVGCKIYAFCGALFGIASMINLLAISIDRYVVITKPLQTIHWSSKRRTTLAILMVWLYSLAWSLAPLVGWSKFSLFHIAVTLCPSHKSQQMHSWWLL